MTTDKRLMTRLARAIHGWKGIDADPIFTTTSDPGSTLRPERQEYALWQESYYERRSAQHTGAITNVLIVLGFILTVSTAVLTVNGEFRAVDWFLIGASVVALIGAAILLSASLVIAKNDEATSISVSSSELPMHPIEALIAKSDMRSKKISENLNWRTGQIYVAFGLAILAAGSIALYVFISPFA